MGAFLLVIVKNLLVIVKNRARKQAEISAIPTSACLRVWSFR
jgi:hypothetical protein